jgi:hypothetical protein
LGLPGWIDIYAGLYGRVGDYDSHKSIDSSQLTVDSDNAAQPTVNSQLSTVNYTGDYWDAGLSAGLTFYFGKRWAVEAGARAGYLHTKAIRYTPDGQYNWFRNNEPPYNKARITDLNVSIIYRFR